mmetsp:Transcript_7679/g.18492  ORF Transcript_7679/g.18492 Transcript_7679/m.18492 type:complete len:338 (-) Transcript_7679:523-1536(-)
MPDENDVAYGVLVPPSRRESEGSHGADDAVKYDDDDDGPGSKATTATHIQESSDDDDDDEGEEGEEEAQHDQLTTKQDDARTIQALEQQYAKMELKYKSELQTAKEEQMELQSTIHLMQTMLDESKAGRDSVSSSSSSAPGSSAFSSANSHSSIKILLRQNDDLKFRVQQLKDARTELRTQVQIATAEARDAEQKLRKTLEERDHAMEGVDKERIWMSTQLSNLEQQVHHLQNENIFLLNTIQEEKDKRDEMMEEHYEKLEQVRREQHIPIPNATVIPIPQSEDEDDNPKPKRSRFGFKNKKSQECKRAGTDQTRIWYRQGLLCAPTTETRNGAAST